MEYPKMLYLGSTTSHKNEIAQNAEHEEELRELGFVDFVDLEDEVNQMMGSAVGGASSEDLVQKELQLSVAQTERDQFKAENDDLKAQIEQLNQVIYSFQPAEHVVVETDYNALTADQLRSLLDKKGIKYLARDDKASLIKLLG
ncbi:hypothetical protein ACK1JC_06095 [Acinetobacter sp. TY2]|uniref:hypothetical protein n=1 Tax=Acinetobacter sp. TY2 TaxID=3387403 RepID=UPI003917864E